MDSFDGVIEFVAVAECHGFAAAAKQLGCSTSHVSRQISRLEQRLGSALLARTTRLVSLTQSGAVYYQQCKELVVGLQQANEQISQQQFQLNGTLRVSGAGPFAEQFVAPALMAFAQDHPELTIDMDFNSRIVNFVEDNFDFAIRYGKLADSGLIARKLASRSMMAVASPGYLQRHGIPTHPKQLTIHSCLISNNDHWQFEHEGVSQSIKISGRWRSNNAHAVVQACQQGLGIAYMPKSSFKTLVEHGLLTPVLEPYWSKGASSWIVYQNRRFLPLRARLAIDYLIAYFSEWRE
ncbi:LysR family transcriptional regulator [Simiduia curdlanivorans]|uniref:LysR family transcriptional regulator n=1 Tax=Simiduia curdlanivorans TaxID=1492769 RepID=A0ABV8V550_9GAMM|nr:LysR family transcriptional regulator [Simiduia curdlanivorans]MDN3640750.1 LysR family transcriptional regulator [Simiduia curdlanivorans]